MKDFKIDLQSKDQAAHVSLTGRINENAEFTPIKGLSQAIVYLDLKNIVSINSSGTRLFLQWLHSLDPRSVIHISLLPRVIVEQMNLIYAHLPATTVIDSFYVPYFCEESQEEKLVLYQRGKEFDDSTLHHPTVTSAAGHKMTVDAPAHYFRFLMK